MEPWPFQRVLADFCYLRRLQPSPEPHQVARNVGLPETAEGPNESKSSNAML